MNTGYAVLKLICAEKVKVATKFIDVFFAIFLYERDENEVAE
jgi:hypothetical protein